MKNKWVKFAAIVGFFTVLTVIFTYPAVFTLNTHFIGDGGDALQNVWNFWWFKRSVFELGTSPFYTDLLHYPFGTTLLFQTLSLANIIIALPFSLFLNAQAVYNIMILFSFVASGVTMFYLSHYLTKNNFASLVAGVIFSFSAYHFAHTLGHLNLVSIQWFPLFTMYLLKVFKEGGTKNALLLGLSLILVALSSWIYLLFAIFLGLILFIWHFKDLLKEKKKFLYLGVGALLFLIVVGPIVFMMIRVMVGEGIYGNHEVALWNADISAYFIPGRFSTFGGLFEGIWGNWNANPVEASLFLGYMAIILSVYALIRVKKTLKWGVIALFFFFLSLGPSLRIFGMNFDILMPFDLLKSIPLMNFSAVTVRYGVMVSFCFAILAAFAIAHLQKPFLKKFKNKIVRIGVPVFLVLFILLENLSIPYMVTKVDIPDFYYEIAEDKRGFSIISSPNNALALYMQTVHKKPMIGGYVSRMTMDRFEFLEQTPVINSLLLNVPYTKGANSKAIFQKYYIKYVILVADTHLEYVRDDLGLELIYDKEMKVFDTGVELVGTSS